MQNLRDGTKYSQYLLFLFIQQSENKAIDHPMQVVDETRTDTMKRKVLCGTVLTSCCALVDEEQSAQIINQFVKLVSSCMSLRTRAIGNY